MWTVAVEEQIYIVFPLLLLPVWRRLGSVWMAVVGIVVGVTVLYVFRPYIASPWYLGLFALGALGACTNFSSRKADQERRMRVPWRRAALVFFVLFYASSEFTARVETGFADVRWVVGTLLGCAITCMLVALTEQWKSGEKRARYSPLRLFEWGPVAGLGKFSYSLYLMHAPVLAMIALLVVNSGLRSVAAYGIIILIGVPVAVTATYLFHRVFERPFMPVSAKKPVSAAAVVEAQAAP
jgi:peptidoglycan/LPS O-acetylase OafA/YrhL